MKHFSWKKMLAALLVCCSFMLNTIYAKTTQDSINDAKEQIDDLKDQREDAEKEIDNISDKREELESELGELNGQLTKLVTSMNELEERITEKEQEISQAAESLTQAEEACQKQYEDMKLRIQFMYENGSETAWQMLLTATSFTEFLNRTEYIVEINNYDRKMLVEFQKLQKDITEQKKQLEQDHAELLAMQEDMKAQQGQVSGLIRTTQEGIDQTKQELADAQADVKELDAKIAKMIEYEKQLEIQKAKEDAARLAAIKQQEKEDTSGVVYVPTDSDLYLLGAIIQCESGGESYEGKLAVGSVIMNRVKSSYFPNTISGVVYQSGQFSPVTSGRLAHRLQTGVSSDCLSAAQEVLNGKITINSLYFRTNNGIIQGTVIGSHVFY